LATNGTFAFGINASGQIVGAYRDASGTHGLLRTSNGTFTTLNDPLATGGTFGEGINDAVLPRRQRHTGFVHSPRTRRLPLHGRHDHE
jgi:hypothetical protein